MVSPMTYLKGLIYLGKAIIGMTLFMFFIMLPSFFLPSTIHRGDSLEWVIGFLVIPWAGFVFYSFGYFFWHKTTWLDFAK